MRTPSFIPERSLRSSLTWRVSAEIAATLLAVLVAYQSLVIAPLSLRQSAANLGVASALVEARLSLLFDQVGRDLRIARQRTREAGSAIDDVDGLNARMIPYMTHTEAVSSALFARDDGREILVLHQSDG